MSHNYSRSGRTLTLLAVGLSVASMSACGSVAHAVKNAAASAMAGTTAGACLEVATVVKPLASQLASGQMTLAQAQPQLPAIEQKLTALESNPTVGPSLTKLVNDAKAAQQTNPTDTAAAEKALATLKSDAEAVVHACLPSGSAS